MTKKKTDLLEKEIVIDVLGKPILSININTEALKIAFTEAYKMDWEQAFSSAEEIADTVDTDVYQQLSESGELTRLLEDSEYRSSIIEIAVNKNREDEVPKACLFFIEELKDFITRPVEIHFQKARLSTQDIIYSPKVIQFLEMNIKDVMPKGLTVRGRGGANRKSELPNDEETKMQFRNRVDELRPLWEKATNFFKQQRYDADCIKMLKVKLEFKQVDEQLLKEALIKRKANQGKLTGEHGAKAFALRQVANEMGFKMKKREGRRKCQDYSFERLDKYYKSCPKNPSKL